MSCVPDKRKGGVSVLIDLFRETFVFGINSSGHSNSTGPFIGQTVRRGTVRCSGCQRGAVDIRIAYSYSTYFSGQFSYTKYFNPTYGLRDIKFQV